MKFEDYMNKVLKKYEHNFNIEENFKVGEQNFPYYGYFISKSQKYVFLKDINLWELGASEHVFFDRGENLFENNKLDLVIKLIELHIEPKLVKEGGKYPPKNHMYTNITFIFIFSNEINNEIKNEIKKFKKEKNYLFSFRGYMSVRIVGVDLKNKKIFANRAAKDLGKWYAKIFKG